LLFLFSADIGNKSKKSPVIIIATSKYKLISIDFQSKSVIHIAKINPTVPHTRMGVNVFEHQNCIYLKQHNTELFNAIVGI
jgi:Golgi nucleoside diphosphatase